MTGGGNKVDEIRQHIEKAYQLISSISVTGDNVDIMAGARSELRSAYQLMKQEKQKRSEEVDNG